VNETAKPGLTNNGADFVATMKALKEALGSDDLAKQVFADANALDRQTLRNNFEARLEYAKQMAQISAETQKALEEQGRQTLKWLLNAGAIALVLTFAGSKAPEMKAALVGALFRPILFFAVGCIFVVGAGAAGFFNFFHGLGTLPSATSLHQFTDPANISWPSARMASEGETSAELRRRLDLKINRTFRVGVLCAVLSALAFVVGAIWSVVIVVRG
jgi:hypothetical protein